jgi:putative ABC transport system permease protein
MIHYLRAFVAKLRGLFGDRRAERELDDEIEAHLRLLTERYVRQGMTEAEAAWAVRRQFGNVTLLKEASSEMRGIRLIDTFFHDLRYGVRMIRRKPGFTLIAVITLALGIGANTAIFSVVNAVLLRPLPYGEPERLVWAWGNFPLSNRAAVSPPDLLDYHRQNQVCAQLAAFAAGGDNAVNLTGGGEPERIPNALVTVNFFQTLGVEPLLGRAFLPDEDQQGRDHVVALSYGLWRRRFGGERGVVGGELTLDGERYLVAGVTPAGFR